MRIIVFFDLPVETATQRREYSRFRQFLIKSGFIMMQESVYCKLVPNAITGESVCASVRKRKPSKGLIQMLVVTEKQYGRMELVLGEYKTEILDTEARMVVL